jgi:hypothetical protein
MTQTAAQRAAAILGAKGGKTKGVAKRRSKEHYAMLAAMKRKKPK